MTGPESIIKLALAARTPTEALAVQDAIAREVGARYMRPLGNTWNNQGLLTASGANYDHKILETVTNMQDAVIELLALKRFDTKDAVPFGSPHEAADRLLDGLTRGDRAEKVSVTIDPATNKEDKFNITLTMRDAGCGITPNQVLRTIFRVGSSTKNGVDWLQGTFGLGGATTYLNTTNVVLVTRRHPDLLGSHEQDMVTVAIIDWENEATTRNAYCLTTSEWNEDRPYEAMPYAVSALAYPGFEPGTHLSLIGFKTNGLAAQSSDQRSFDSVFNTRLFRPVTPVRFVNNIVRDRVEIFDGLERRWRDNPPSDDVDGFIGQAAMPFNAEGETYRLPILYRVFSAPGNPGEHRKFVAKDHALTLTSNGQVHAHWTPPEFRTRTKLNRLYNRVFVTVSLDAIPAKKRAQLFTADRAQLVQKPMAKKLENEIVEHLNTLPALVDENNRLRREFITGSRNDRPTIAIAEEIARAFKAKGFSLGGSGGSGGGSRKPPEPMSPDDLYLDPTHFEGPDHVVTGDDTSKSIFFKLNAVDQFLGTGRRGQLDVSIDHPDIRSADITIDDLHAGRLRIKVPVPDSAALGTFTLQADIADWQKSAGGLGRALRWTTKFEVVDQLQKKRTGSKRKSGKKVGSSGSDEGALVALIWASSDDDRSPWNRKTVGEVEMVPASELANREGYEELAGLDIDVPTIMLNSSYSPFKRYIAERTKDISTEHGMVSNEDRYATGVGVGLLILHEEIQRRDSANELALDDDALLVAGDALARSVLSTMPYADRILQASMD